MASNKECVIIVLDVREHANDEFKQKSIKCAAEILKDNICAAKGDYISFVLLGTSRTFNDVNSNVFHDCYYNIVQYPQVQTATWQLLINFYKFVNEESCNEGEWLEALIVAMEMLKNAEETFKFQRQRILLFYDFNGANNNYEMFDVICENIVKQDVALVVVSGNIAYIDNPVNGEPQPIFRQSKKTEEQLENEKYALRLVTNANAKLCNFVEALRTIFKVQNKRPWSWNKTLTIGSKIKICISGILAIKDESKIKLKKCWGDADELVSRERKSFVRGNEVEPLPEELIEGYMLGATPIPFDDTILDCKPKYEEGLRFLGFAKRHSIPQEYFCGDSLYCIVHQKGMTASAKMLDALVKALIATEMAILCWKVYSVKYNNPKLVILLPNKLHADRPASLAMIDLSYHAQHHFWDFPTLCTQKTECSAEQVAAIDELIDSMDLMLDSKNAQQQPRDSFQKDLLPFETLPHIYEQNIMDILERKVLCNASEDDEQFQEMLQDKNFVEVFWKVPELIEQKAKNAANKVKKLFPLEKNMAALNKAKTKAAETVNAANALKSETNNNNKMEIDVKPTTLDIDCVGQQTPAEDFEKLLQGNVVTLQHTTQRSAKFEFYAAQMRATIRSLICNPTDEQLETQKLAKALTLYRKKCFDFNAIEDYNIWIREVRAIIMDQKLYDFWRDVIVKHDLGLCIVGEPLLEDKLNIEQFYSLDGVHSLEMKESVDDLLANI